jgi:hypothetical protein
LFFLALGRALKLTQFVLQFSLFRLGLGNLSAARATLCFRSLQVALRLIKGSADPNEEEKVHADSWRNWQTC